MPTGEDERSLDALEVEEDPSEHDTHSFAICYVSIVQGDRVGVQPQCNHVFHVDCLKVWLSRRNVCPLCLSKDVATPQCSIEKPQVDIEDSNEDGDSQSASTAPISS